VPPNIQVFDGVAISQRGDLLVFVYEGDARVHRTRWAFDRADEFARKHPGGILILFLIPPGSAPPDGATRSENAVRFRQLLPGIRRFVTVPLGDAMRAAIVRAVMRAMILVQRHSRSHVIADTESEAISFVLEVGGKDTPGRAMIEADIRALREALATTTARAS
jgi:hypothetical protein